jgi:DNA-binding transcriptional LysR family regulator
MMGFMNEIDVGRLDLNLLGALHALLSEGSVTAAARRLGVGQPAASHALMRLRALFGDPLFVRVGARLVPTSRAEAVREPLARILAQATDLVGSPAAFDAPTSRRTFALACPDLLAPVLGPLATKLRARAPSAGLEVVAPGAEDLRALADGRLDLALTQTPDEGAGLVRRGLGALPFAVAMRRGHPAARTRKLAAAEWSAYGHVMVRTGHVGRSVVSGEVARAKVERRIGLVVPSFLAALVAVADTDLFFTAPRDLLVPHCARFGLHLAAPPIVIAPVVVSALWHERYHADEGARFFRELVIAELAVLLRHRGSGARRRTTRR